MKSWPNHVSATVCAFRFNLQPSGASALSLNSTQLKRVVGKEKGEGKGKERKKRNFISVQNTDFTYTAFLE